MDIFNYKNYQIYLQEHLHSLPKRGHGLLRKLALHMNVHTTFVSQVFSGQKPLNPEQGLKIADFFGLSELETHYFIKLIQLERAGSEEYKKILEQERQQLYDKSQKISNRVNAQDILSDDKKAIFYSDWYYSAIRLQTSIPGYDELEALAQHFSLPRRTVNQVIQFLLENKLLIREQNKLVIGPSRTHVASDSPFIKMHHLNWRQKAIEQISYPHPQKLHYSSPMTLGKKEIEIIRNRLLQLIDEVGKIIAPAPNEELMCLNIDWFQVESEKNS